MDWLVLVVYIVGSYALVSLGLRYFWRELPDSDKDKKQK